MRLFLALALLLAVLSITKAFPATKNGPPFQIEEEEFDNDSKDPPIQVEDNIDSHGPVPNGPHQNPVMDEKSAGHENNDMVMMKRMPLGDSAWSKSGSTVEIPYTTTSGVDSDVLTRAIEVFNAKTCVRFIPRNNQANYVQFQSGTSCVAAVGNRDNGMQTCSLTSGCASNKGKVLHEMMHILGFLHEQCRPDRDSYVTVHLDRIKPSAHHNFEKRNEGVDQGIPYDCDSILHYRSTAFAITSGQETITSSHCSHLGNGDTRLSLKDYKRVNTLYSCGKPEYKYYTVRVITHSSWVTGSGTDCFIYLTLHGSSGQTSTEFELDLSTNPDADLFEAGSDDTFNYMAYRNDLGSITGMSLRMVSNNIGPDWWPTKFIVTDPATSTSVTFTSNQWLSPSSTYGTSNFPTQ